MQYSKEIVEIFDNLNISSDLYEVIRFVDPLEKKVLIYEGKSLKEEEYNCYDMWERNTLCLNCTSMRAYNEGKTFIKMEHDKSNIYMVTSIPVNLADKSIVIELLRNATLNIGFQDENLNSDMYKTIDSMNNELIKDSLTNVFNKRYIDELLPVNVAISNTINQDFSIMIVDIDFFKTINDTHGHSAGDAVLKKFASILTQCIPDGNSWLARYGGEEFIVSLNDFTKEEVMDLAETMRQSLEEAIFSSEDAEIKLTASFGIASIKDIDKPDVSKLIGLADKNLYKAKNNGRNNIVH